jgi:hypothetical protein
MSNIQEVRARGGHVIAVATEGDERSSVRRGCALRPGYPRVPEPDAHGRAAAADGVSRRVLRGHDVDKPRNLAKSVTVEYEFQDTNRAQLLLVKQLVGPSGNVFCVGDDDQSIYGWRGADIANVIDFGTHFPGAKKLALEQNYRSRRPVLEVANAIMEGQVRAFPKRLFTDREGRAWSTSARATPSRT